MTACSLVIGIEGVVPLYWDGSAAIRITEVFELLPI